MKNSFGEFLRQKRQEKNLTQKELSNLLFVSEYPSKSYDSASYLLESHKEK